MPLHPPRPPLARATARTSARRAATIAVALAPAAPRRAAAQAVTTSLDVGGAGMQWGDSLTTTNTVAGTVAPAVQLDWTRATLGAGGSWSHLGTGWSSQGALSASV